MGKLDEKRIAVLMTDGVEQIEFVSPFNVLAEAGAEIVVVSPKDDVIRAWNDGIWDREIDVDLHINQAFAEDFDGLLLPGGVINPDKLRQNNAAVNFAKSFFEQGKPVAAICHGPQLLIDAEVVSGRRMTSYPAIKKDLENAGAEWVNESVVVDEGLTTSRSPEDLSAFNNKMVEEFCEGVHAGQEA